MCTCACMHVQQMHRRRGADCKLLNIIQSSYNTDASDVYCPLTTLLHSPGTSPYRVRQKFSQWTLALLPRERHAIFSKGKIFAQTDWLAKWSPALIKYLDISHPCSGLQQETYYRQSPLCPPLISPAHYPTPHSETPQLWGVTPVINGTALAGISIPSSSGTLRLHTVYDSAVLVCGVGVGVGITTIFNYF